MKKYYKYQTKARGLLTEQALESQFKKSEKWYWARLKNYIPKDKEASCLDAPCGYDNFLYFLRSKRYNNIRGYDFDEFQVGLAKLLNLPAETEDIFHVLAESKNTYDLISSLDFTEHVSKGDALKFLEQCRHKLSQNGILILRTPCADGPFGSHDANNDITHEWSMTSNVLKTILEISGFSRVVMLDERPLPINFLGLIRWLMFFPSKLIANLLCIGLGMRPPDIWSRSMIAIACK